MAQLMLGAFALACSGATNPGSPAVAPPRAKSTPQSAQSRASLRERLQRELGGGRPVALVASQEGVVAVGLDARRRLLVEGNVDWVFVDDRAGVVWYEVQVEGKYELRLLDWGLPSPSAERVATGLGEDDAVDVVIAYAESPHGIEEVHTHAGTYDGYVRLLLTAAGPVWTYEGGIYDAVFEREAEQRAQKLAPLSFVATAKARLRELNERARGRSLLLGAVALPQPAANVAAERCWDATLCGEGQALPGTPWLRVIVSHECGDACHVRYQLFDPARREFLEHTSARRSPLPIDDRDPESVEDVWIAAGGEGFSIAGSVYDRAGKMLFRGDRRGGGWLGGQWHLE